MSHFLISRFMIAAAPPNLDWEFLFLAVPLFIGIWSAVLAFVSLIGGWHGLAKLYRREETTFSIGDDRPVEKFGWTSLKMGPKFFPTNYGNCITVSLSDDGIGLRVMPLFRPLHPPLLIPWTSIESCQRGKEIQIFDRAVIQVQGVAHQIRIYGRAARAIERLWTARMASHPPRE
jgi:hypothetical protein